MLQGGARSIVMNGQNAFEDRLRILFGSFNLLLGGARSIVINGQNAFEDRLRIALRTSSYFKEAPDPL